MAIVTPDIRAQMPTASEGPNGLELRRSYYVVGIGGEADIRIMVALTDPGIPKKGSVLEVPYNNTTVFLLVLNKSAKIHPDNGDLVQVDVEWGVPQPLDTTQEPNLDSVPAIEVGGTLQSVQTMHDVDGNLIIVHYADPVSQATISQPVMVEQQQPMPILRFHRREPGEQPLPIGDKADKYLGALNAIKIWNAGPRMWRCVEFVARSVDNGLTYGVDYGFQRSPKPYTWDAIGVYQRPDGTTPDDVSPVQINPDTGLLMKPDNGLVMARMAPLEVFQLLHL